MPGVRDVRVDECVVEPVVEKVIIIELYGMFCCVENLQVAGSSVLSEIVVCVVVEGKDCPCGFRFNLFGGFVSGPWVPDIVIG